MKDSNIKDELKTFDNTLDQILELLDSDTQQFIYLTGAAGTGKTTLIEKVLEENNLKKIVVAPTGVAALNICLLYTSPSPRDMRRSRMPSSA